MEEMRLLKMLQKDPRATVTDLADILGESEQDISDAITSLEEKKIIVGYHTIINWDKTSEERVEAIIEVSAKPERDKGYDKIAERISRYPEVSDCYLMSGKNEFFVIINERTMREIADFVGQKLAPIDGVLATVTCFVLKKYKAAGVMLDAEEEVDDRQPVTP